jgi:hypothetical protein
MMPERLRRAQHLMADRARSIPEICRELNDMPASKLRNCLYAGGTLKTPGRKLLDEEMGTESSTPGRRGGVSSIGSRPVHART